MKFFSVFWILSLAILFGTNLAIPRLYGLIVCKLVCFITYFSRFLVTQFATIIEQTAGLLSSSAEDTLRQFDDAKRSVPEDGSALLIIKGNYNSSTTRVVHVKIDLT